MMTNFSFDKALIEADYFDNYSDEEIDKTEIDDRMEEELPQEWEILPYYIRVSFDKWWNYETMSDKDSPDCLIRLKWIAHKIVYAIQSCNIIEDAAIDNITVLDKQECNKIEPVNFKVDDIPETFNIFTYEYPSGQKETRKGQPLFKFKFEVNVRFTKQVPSFDDFCKDILNLQKRIRYTVNSMNRKSPSTVFSFYRRNPDSKYDDWMGADIENSSIPDAEKLATIYNNLFSGIEDWNERTHKSMEMGKTNKGILQSMIAGKLKPELLMNTMAHYAFEKHRLKMIPTRYVGQPPTYGGNDSEGDKFHYLIGVLIPKDTSRKFIDLGEIEDSVCNGFLRWLPSFTERIATFLFAFTIEQSVKDIPEEKKKEFLANQDNPWRERREIENHRHSNFYNKDTSWEFEVETIGFVDHYTDKRKDHWWKCREITWGDYGHSYMFLCNKNGQINNSPFGSIKFFEKGIEYAKTLMDMIDDKSIWDQKLPSRMIPAIWLGGHFFESSGSGASGVAGNPVNEDWFDKRAGQDEDDEDDKIEPVERSKEQWSHHVQLTFYLEKVLFITINRQELQEQLRGLAADVAMLLERLPFISETGQMKFKIVYYGTDVIETDILPDFSNVPDEFGLGTALYGEIPFNANPRSIRDADIFLNSIFMRYPVLGYSYSSRKFNKFKFHVNYVTVGEASSMSADIWNWWKRHKPEELTKAVREEFMKKMSLFVRGLFSAWEHPYEQVMKFYNTPDLEGIIKEFGKNVEITSRCGETAIENVMFNKIMLLQPSDYTESDINGFCAYNYED